MRLRSVGVRAALAAVFVLAADCRLMPLPTEWSDAALPADGCDDRLWGHTWFAEDRLTTVSLCVAVEGTVREAYLSPDGDGDMIIELETDPRLVNHANRNGWLKVEAVCQNTGTQEKHRSACRGFTGPYFAVPPVGTRVRATGRYVADRGHGGHMEIHPLSRLEPLD
jgi:hypothetical protein